MNARRSGVLMALTLLLNTVPNALPSTAPALNLNALNRAAAILEGAIGATPAGAAARRLAEELEQRAIDAARAARDATPPAARPAAGAALLLMPGALAAGLVTRRRDPRRRVRALARRGVAVAAIARRTGVAQDAVRALIGPEGTAADRRQSLPGGRERRPRALSFEERHPR